MKRFIPAAMSAVLCAACIIFAFSTGRQFSRAPDARFTGPGTYRFSVPEVAEYTLWHEFTGSIDGEFSVREDNLPTGTKIRITHSGLLIDTVADMSTTTTSSNGQRKSVLHFMTPAIGDYQIDVTGLADKRAFEITHGPILMPLLFTIGWIGGASLLGLLTVVLALLAALRVFPKRPNQTQSQPIGGSS